ncbi:unnamed protein product [Pedinophyceae sp. YPF-701]|nr:unnamed protein product [Pedinophyceae sp. YPF-701]
MIAARVMTYKPAAVAMAQRRQRRAVAARANRPEAKDQIEAAVEEAKAACSTDNPAACAAAWDVVEELSAEASHKKSKEAAKDIVDPIDEFCKDEANVSEGECRVYED